MTTPPTPAHANAMAATAVAAVSAAADDSLIEYPCLFPIKVMGANVEGFASTLMDVASSFDPTYDRTTVELRESKGGKYMGVTLHVRATSRAQLDDIYHALTSHPMVKIVL